MKMKSRLATLLVTFAITAPLSATELERLRALCAEQEMQIRQLELKISRITGAPPTTNASASVPQAPAETTYKVMPGDSVERIARKNGISVASLNQINGLKPNAIIHPGLILKLPVAGASAAESPENTPVKAAAEMRTHTVRPGDTYFKISRKYGVTVDQLIAANPSVNHRALRVGQKLNISIPAREIAKTKAAEPVASFSSTDSIPISNTPAPVQKPRASDQPILISKEITYGHFAKNHNTTTSRLDELNGLELDPSTVLAQGSELYIPAQP